MAILDDLYLCEYDPEKYNCAHFAGEVWHRLTGDDRLKKVAAIYTDRKLPPYKEFRRLTKGFKKTSRAEKLGIVICEPPFEELHLAILWEGCLVHLTPGGVECLELCVYDFVFKNIRVYK